MGYYNGPRRYYLRKAQNASRNGDHHMAAVWRAKQLAIWSDALPDGFPYSQILRAYGYLGVQDLNGADARELTLVCGLMQHEAEQVLFAALELAS